MEDREATVTIPLTQDEAAFVLNELRCAGHGSSKNFHPNCPSCTAADKIEARIADGVKGLDRG